MSLDPDDLERRVHRALAELPAIRAPRTLRARVTAAVSPPVVGHPWFTWSWPVQVAVVLVAAAAVTGVTWGWPMAMALIGGVVPDSLQTGAGYVGSAAETSAVLVRLLQLTWMSVVAPIARIVLVLSLLLCAACAMCLAALSRVAPGGASQS